MLPNPPEMRVRPAVLMIEDCLDVLDLYAMTLEHDVKVAKASRGVAGLAAAVAEPPDVIVLDLGLPDLDGWEVWRRLHEAPETRAIPVIVLTGSENADVEQRGIKEGVAGVLRKPCSADRLLHMIRDVSLRRSPLPA
jgi:CheY-like chemotaxis protein